MSTVGRGVVVPGLALATAVAGLTLGGVAHALEPTGSEDFAGAPALDIPTDNFLDFHRGVGQTLEDGEPQPSCGRSGGTITQTTWVKYTHTGASDALVEISLFDQSWVGTPEHEYDEFWAVWTGSSLATLSQVACKDDDGATTHPLSLSFAAQPGRTYFVQMGVHDATGQFAEDDWMRAKTTPLPPDTTRPTAQITRLVVRHRMRMATVRFTGSDDRTPMAGLRYRCRIDTRRSALCTSPKLYERLKPGRHLVRVWAIDRAGNASGSVAKRFRVRR